MKKIKISLILNSIIFLFMIFATACMLLDIKFMKEDFPFVTTRVENFKFFTVQSNIFVGIISLILLVCEILFIKKKIKEIPRWAYILKMMSTLTVVLTFLVTLLFLAPFATTRDFFSYYKNSNLFYHFLIPLISFISFIFFEGRKDIKFRYTFLGIVPILVYGIVYGIFVISNIKNGIVPEKYDFYGFLRGGASTVYFVIPLMIIIVYILSYGLWFFNKKLCKENS